jgi:hypothetical protein
MSMSRGRLTSGFEVRRSMAGKLTFETLKAPKSRLIPHRFQIF